MLSTEQVTDVYGRNSVSLLQAHMAHSKNGKN